MGLLAGKRRGPYRPAASGQGSRDKGLAMRIRARKLIGTVGLLVLVTVWALLAMAFAQFALRAQSGWVAALFYAVAGLGWVLPAMPLVSWMQRPDRT
jgi:uncharacterized protein DUF2842